MGARQESQTWSLGQRRDSNETEPVEALRHKHCAYLEMWTTIVLELPFNMNYNCLFSQFLFSISLTPFLYSISLSHSYELLTIIDTCKMRLLEAPTYPNLFATPLVHSYHDFTQSLTALISDQNHVTFTVVWKPGLSPPMRPTSSTRRSWAHLIVELAHSESHWFHNSGPKLYLKRPQCDSHLLSFTSFLVSNLLSQKCCSLA